LEINWFDHLFVILVGLVIPAMSLISGSMSEDKSYQLPPKKHLYFTNGLVLIIGALLVLSSWNMGNKPWKILGFVLPMINPTVIWSTIILVFLYLGDSILSLKSVKHNQDDFQHMSLIVPLNWKEYFPYMFLAFAAGICEEIIYRGFLIPYILHYLPVSEFSYIIALVVPGIIFAISHFYQGTWSVLKIFLISILFGLIFFYSGSLLIVVIIHILIDLMSGIMGVLVFKELEKEKRNQL
jgi:uncharacterized protein